MPPNPLQNEHSPFSPSFFPYPFSPSQFPAQASNQSISGSPPADSAAAAISSEVSSHVGVSGAVNNGRATRFVSLTPAMGPKPKYIPETNNVPEAIPGMHDDWKRLYSTKHLPPPPPKMYSDRNSLVEDVKKWAQEHGYALAIQHSAKYKGEESRLRMACSLSGTFSENRRVAPEDRKRKRDSKKINCPMKISASRKRFANEWILRLPEDGHALHNHGPAEKPEDNVVPGVPALPELESELFAWQKDREEQGIVVHGNSLKAKAFEIFKTSPVYQGIQTTPDFDQRWLYEYRIRHGLPIPAGNQYKPKLRPQDSMNELQSESRGDENDDDVEDQQNSNDHVIVGGARPVAQQNNIFSKVRDFVKTYMSQFDASHDWNHILRVVALARKILTKELNDSPHILYDTNAVVLAGLLHDIGDKKYNNGQDDENQIANLLLNNGCSDDLALKVQMIAKNVSFSNEMKNPRLVRAILSQHPELGIVQDADRLDAIGAVGIGRTFTFAGAKRPKQNMNGTIDHFTEKLEKLESMMKTDEGKRLARERTQRLAMFKEWWSEENNIRS